MSETTKKKVAINDIMELTKIMQSGELQNISKTVKDLRANAGKLVSNAKSIRDAELQSAAANAPVQSENNANTEAPTVKTAKVENTTSVSKSQPVETTPVVEAVAKAPVTSAPVAKVAVENSTEKAVAKTAEPVQSATATPTANGEEAPVLTKEEREAAAIARAVAKAQAIENRLKKYYSENPRENTGGQRPYNNNRPQGQGGYNNNRPPRLDKDGKPYPPRTNNYQGNSPNYQGNSQRPPYGQRPAGGGYQGGGFDKDKDAAQRPPMRKPMGAKPGVPGFTPPSQPAKQFGNKNKTKGNDQDKKGMNKRTLIRKGFIVDSNGADENGVVKMRSRKNKVEMLKPAFIKIEHAVLTTDIIQIKMLSEKIGIGAAEIVKKLFAEGIMKTINDSIDFATAEYVALMYNITLEYKPAETAEDVLFKDVEEDEANLQERPPVVTVMGHVDHGKTSLLDAIRNANVTTGEAGGITQHIGAYSVEINGKKITFIDTPGHAAFTSMRKRGAQITDIAILVVAADDGVMPQTIEAINHIKAAEVEMIVAVNKIDKPNANKDRIMQQLTEHEVLGEEWGGTTIVAPVSATTKEGITALLESILLLAEVKELKANPNRKASGIIVEAKLDKGKGPVATMLIQTGTLKIGDTVISGFTSGRIRAMMDDKGERITEAGPSQAVSILGLSDVPEAGERIMAVENDKMSRAVLEERMKKSRESMVQSSESVSLEDLFIKVSEGQLKVLNLIVKADVQGSVEAVKQSLSKLSNEEVIVKIIHSGVGAINESDVMLASTAGAIIIAFNVRPDAKTKNYAEKEKVEIKPYRIIYEAIEDIEKALKGMLAPIFKETHLGNIEIRDVFKITGSGTIAGCYVTDGKILRNSTIRLMREGIVIHEGEMCSLKRFKDDVKEVNHGYECGVGILNFDDMKVGDIIECSLIEEIKRD